MDTESQPVNLRKSWISEHPFVVIGIILVACLGPFVNKAIETDDALFVWTAEWIQKHPLDFFGCMVNWWASAVPMWVANWNPPLMSYFLAGVASLFGWHEIVLHLACLAVALSAAAGIYSLAKMWCERPLLATVVAIFTPAFLVSSTTLMCDVLMLTFWIWAVVLWERALTCSEQRRWQFVGAGALAGLAVLTKYSAVTLLPLLPVLAVLRTRKLGWWLAGLAVPLMMVAGFEWITAGMYGRGLLSAASYHAQTFRFGFPGGWKARGIIGLAFAGGSLLPLLFFAPWLWRWRTLLTGSVTIFAILPGMFWLGGDLGLIHPWENPEVMKHWDFRLQVVLLTAGGLHLLLLTAVETWQRRNIISLTLGLWIASGLFFAMVLNWTVSARSFLPIVPAAVILLVRRLGAIRRNAAADGWLLWPLVPSAAIALGLVMADYELANSARTTAEQITAKYKSAVHQMWFEGHEGFQYYMERLGGLPVDVERSLLLPGDIVVVSWLSGNYVVLPPGSVEPVEIFAPRPYSWLNLKAGYAHSAAGFYTSDWGPVPFALGGLPPQACFVARVSSRVQFKSQPANPQEVKTGGVPSFPRTFASCPAGDQPVFPEGPEAIKQMQLACQLEKDGKIEEAIQHYQKMLAVDSNNPVALNNLAWILAAAGKPELRDGNKAVQLAMRAVKLTGGRKPIFIGTLAAAFAEAGQFSKAVNAADVAHDLAQLTGQQDVAKKNEELLTLYSSGKAVASTQTQ